MEFDTEDPKEVIRFSVAVYCIALALVTQMIAENSESVREEINDISLDEAYKIYCLMSEQEKQEMVPDVILEALEKLEQS